MKMALAIGTGSFIGGISRYLLYHFIHGKTQTGFPLGTLCINVIGCFLIGLVYGISERGNMTAQWQLFLATGVLGGFTTFSAFSIETVNLIREGQVFYASAYIISSILLGLIATFIALYLIRQLLQ